MTCNVVEEEKPEVFIKASVVARTSKTSIVISEKSESGETNQSPLENGPRLARSQENETNVIIHPPGPLCSEIQ